MLFDFFSSDHSSRNGWRYTKPKLLITMGKNTYETVDWSPAGCRISGFHKLLNKGSGVVINAIKPENGEAVVVFLQGSVVMQDIVARTLSIQFDDLCESSVVLFDRLLSGEPVPTKDRRRKIRPQARGFGRRGLD